MRPMTAAAAAIAAILIASPVVADSLPPGFETPGAVEVLRATGVGAQIYQCAKGADGGLAWKFREPVASLIDAAGKTLGRHFAGPTWELQDLSAIVGNVVAKSAGARPQDVPWLKLDVVSARGKGGLDGVTHVLRLETKGGELAGGCAPEGAFHAEPYSATYVFLK